MLTWFRALFGNLLAASPADRIATTDNRGTSAGSAVRHPTPGLYYADTDFILYGGYEPHARTFAPERKARPENDRAQ